MIADKKWHSGVACIAKDGAIVIYDNIEEADERAEADELKIPIEYQPVRYNYNSGQPLIDTGSFTGVVVDNDLRKLP